MDRFEYPYVPTYIFLVTLVGNQCCCHAVLHYLSKKPLGLQTFFDLIFKDFILAFLIYSALLLTNLLLGMWFFGHLNDHFLNALYLLTMYFYFTFQIYGSASIIVKYISLFWSSIINSIQDEKLIMKRIRITIFIATTIYFISLNIFGIHGTDGALYQILKHGYGSEAKISPYVAIFHFSNLILALILQCRKELDYWRYREDYGIINQISVWLSKDSQPEDNRHNNVLERIVIVIYISTIFIMFFLPPFIGFETPLKFLIKLFAIEVYFFLLPLTYILTYESVRRHTLRLVISL